LSRAYTDKSLRLQFAAADALETVDSVKMDNQNALGRVPIVASSETARRVFLETLGVK